MPSSPSDEEFANQHGLGDPTNEGDSDDSIEEEFEVGATTRKVNLLNKFALHSSSMRNNDNQRETIFHTKCEVQDKVLSLVVDGGSCNNIVSKEVVDKLGMITQKLEEPYRLCWLDDDKDIKVNSKTLLAFVIGL